MPMETTMNVGVRPVDRPQSTGSTDGVNRRGDGSGSSSAFSPKTNVSIQTAVDDMAGILAKISSNQAESVEGMPKDLQKLVQNIMKQAFSLNESLGQGLGSTLESQRFSMDQLGTLSRMLSQLGAMAEKGATVEVSDTLQALLSNLKTLTGEPGGGKASLEPVLLSKVAFELLDNKEVSDLPEQLQQLLTALQPQGQSAVMTTGNSNPMAFLKQLVQYFMPRPVAESAGQMPSQGQNGGAAQGGQGNKSTASQTAGQLQVNQSGGQPESPVAGQEPAARPASTGQPGMFVQSKGQPAQSQGQTTAQTTTGNPSGGQLQTNTQNPVPENNPQARPQTNGQPAQTAPENPLASQSRQGTMPQSNTQNPVPENNPQARPQTNGQPAQTTPENSSSGQPRQSTMPQPNTQSLVQENNPQLRQQLGQSPVGQSQTGSTPQQNALNQARTQLMMQKMENTPQAMDTMKSLAQLLLRDANLTQKDAVLLQNFVNGQSTQLSEKDAKQLQQMIRLCQANVPATVQQAALQQNIPDLPRLWAFMQLCDMGAARRMNARQLKRAGKDVAAFAASMRTAMGGENTSVQGQRSLNFMLPMYMGEECTYPSYIHVYDERQQDPESGELKKETWLRICVLTDHIGAVELTCRVYHERQLDMRLFFSDTATANEFRAQADSLREALKDSPLQLNDFKIGAAGERRFI